MSNPQIVHLGDIVPRPGVFTTWERRRHSGPVHWFVECFAEFLGVFFYVYAGVGSTAAWVLGNILKEAGLSSIFQIGFAYAAGILFALGVCGATSGGHFNPCVSIAMVLFKGFPPLKALRYIVAQIFGAYIACLIIYAQYRDLIVAAETGLAAVGALNAIQFTPNGPAGIFALYAMPGSHLGRVFLNEFVTDTFLALVIWAAIDPTNILIPPPVAPFIVALAYASAIWGYAVPGLAANSARDVGGRLAAMTLWGTEASGGTYAALAALTNIPAMLLGVLIYELFLHDSDRVVPTAQLEYMRVHKYHRRNGHGNGVEDSLDSASSADGKAHIEHDRSHA